MTPVERLFALEQFGIKLGLDNIRAILDALDHPEQAWRSVHIAGTNGKGSVAAMVERGLRAAGLKTGRYTSPHLNRIEERVAINGSAVDASQFAAATADVLQAADEAFAAGALTVSPTFFEVSTSIAFEIFRREGVEAAVVEVGLGGRFDATNVVNPVVTAITSIAFDHERHLGSTLSDIAFEKAGIAKAGVPLVVGPVPPEARTRIRAVAATVGAPIIDAKIDWRAAYPGVRLSLLGRHQEDNAAVAIAVMETWSSRVAPVQHDAIVAGLSDSEWPARLEWLRRPGGGRLLVDAAHNPAGALALADYLRDEGMTPIPVVLAVMKDKDVAAMVRALVPAAASFVATTVPHPRARAAEDLAAVIRELAPSATVDVEPSPDRAVERAVADAKAAVVAGSIFLIGPLRSRLLAGGYTIEKQRRP